MEEQAERHEKLSSRKRKAGLGFDAPSGETPPSHAPDRPLDVAQHYNNLVDRRRSLTSGSDILHVRNLHNWVKAVLLGKFTPRGACVLDLACGKGGDMLKFKAAGAAHYVGVDIAHESVRDAVARFNGVPPRPPMPFSADFLTADFCDEALGAALPEAAGGEPMRFHLVSCQFAFHYSFASEQRAETLMRLVSARLLPGGVFVGTTTDACVLVKRLRHAERLTFGNTHYECTFAAAHAEKRFSSAAPYGIAYNWTLQEAVDDCQEYLVPRRTLVELAARFDLELVLAQNFVDFFAAEYCEPRGAELLWRMKVLSEDSPMTEEEWEVSHGYMAFAFRKKGAAEAASSGARGRHRRYDESRITRVGGVGAAGAPASGDAEPDDDRAAVVYDDGGHAGLFD